MATTTTTMATAMDVPMMGSVDRSVKKPILDPRIDRMLWHLEDDAKRNVIEELIFDLELDELLEARDAIFEEVTAKGIQQDGDGNPNSAHRKCTDTLFPSSTRSIAIPWKLIKRRVPSIAADDLCEMYLYRMDPSKGFPYKILKRKALCATKRDAITDNPPMSIIVEQEDEAVLTQDIVPNSNINASNNHSVADDAENVSLIDNESFPEIDHSNGSSAILDNDNEHNNGPPKGQPPTDMQIGFWETPAATVMQNQTHPATCASAVAAACSDHSSTASSGAGSIAQLSVKESSPNPSIEHSYMGGATSTCPNNPVERVGTVSVKSPTAEGKNVVPNSTAAVSHFRVPQPADKVRSLSTEVPSPRTPATADKATATTVEMATQTGPNVIYDPPVKKSEFTSQMDYIDRSMTDHERRMRAIELRTERSENKVNNIDADIYTMYSDLRASHESLIDDHNNLKRIVTDILKVSPIYEKLILHDESSLCVPVNAALQCDNRVPIGGTKSGDGGIAASTTAVRPPSLPANRAPPQQQEAAAPSVPVTENPANRAPHSIARDTPFRMSAPVDNRGATPTAPILIPAPNPEIADPYYMPQNPNRERRVAEKKRSETSIESFLKEAKRVIPKPPPRRTPNGVQRPPADATKRMTSTPSNNQSAPKPIALSNMFAALDNLETDAQIPRREGQGKQIPQKEQIDITSPEQFPLLPKSRMGEASPLGNKIAGPEPARTANQAEESWAEIVDEEDNKTIEAFLATVENKNIPVANTATRSPARPPPPSDRAGEKHPIAPTSKGNSNQNRMMTGASGALPENNKPTNVPPALNTNRPSQKGDQQPHATTRGAEGGLPRKAQVDVRPKNTRNTQNNNENVRNHPERVVSKNGWRTKKRKRTKSSSVTFPTICGGYTKPFRDIFVGNLRNDLYDDPEEMSDAIQDFCEERGIEVYYIRILSSQFEGFSNVKLTVATCDYYTVIDNDFWPENVTAREWYQGNNDKKGGNPRV